MTANMLYDVEHPPPWYIAAFMGLQHFLLILGSTFTVPFLLAPPLCMADDDPGKVDIMATTFFVGGIATLIQSVFGIRLPVIQSVGPPLVLTSLGILSLPDKICPSDIDDMSFENKTEVWQLRIRELQGGVIMGSLLTTTISAFGIIGFLMRYIGPLTIAPIIMNVGISLLPKVASSMSTHWPISIGTVLTLTVFSQHLNAFLVPIPIFKKTQGCKISYYKICQLFSILLAVMFLWITCVILTVVNILPADSLARTDINIKQIQESPWFRVPYPGQWGTPTFSLTVTLSILFGMIVDIFVSTGAYCLISKASGAPPPPIHAINRGLTIEGINNLIAGLFGSIGGIMTYISNVGAINITKVGSRRVVQWTGLIMIIMGVFGKISAIFVSIPEPVIGGLFCMVFSLIIAAGMSNLSVIDWTASRNVFIIGISLFLPLIVLTFLRNNPTAIQTGNIEIDNFLTIMLSSAIFTSGVLGFTLDNTVPGTRQERGLEVAESQQVLNDETTIYDCPFGMKQIKSHAWTSWIPFSPTFIQWKSCRSSLPTCKFRLSFSRKVYGVEDGNTNNHTAIT